MLVLKEIFASLCSQPLPQKLRTQGVKQRQSVIQVPPFLTNKS
ncbi:hypothetical protein CAMRE0001_0626 [Campylobacter rectus RM3267]|uniref:Uncharacterized protein n=1 Tax=Campylobacter rectus RM3267 TaxID=553218 RepID=B9D1G7_CAMRE|nr:hypothetical protein CAMRE0001_0626 [Campylobacter rectus RM3267]